MLLKIQEKLYLPLRAAWAARNGLPENHIRTYTDRLLRDIDQLARLHCQTAIILGSTRATSFAVRDALRAGHSQFLIVGGKPIGQEHPAFTHYIEQHMNPADRDIARENPAMTEIQYAEKLLIRAGVQLQNILHLPDDKTMNTGANMKVLAQSEYAREPALEFYTLAGFARRAFMTARKELGQTPVIVTHNAYPEKVTADHWATNPVACAHMAGEAAKVLGDSPLYTRCGYTKDVDFNAERNRAVAHMRTASFQNTPSLRP